MRLVWQWVQLERELPPNWTEIRVALTSPRRRSATAPPRCSAARTRCAAATSCASSSRGSGAFGPEAFRRALLRLDRQGIDGTLELEHLDGGRARGRARRRARSLRSGTPMTANLPPDWTRHARRGRAPVERPARARGAPRLARQPAPRRRQPRASLPRRAPVRLRRLRRHDAPQPRAARRRKRSRARCASFASSPTPIPSARRARSGASAAAPSDARL